MERNGVRIGRKSPPSGWPPRLDKLMSGPPDPLAGIDLMVQTGLGEVVLAEIGAMQMAIDEHNPAQGRLSAFA